MAPKQRPTRSKQQRQPHAQADASPADLPGAQADSDVDPDVQAASELWATYVDASHPGTTGDRLLEQLLRRYRERHRRYHRLDHVVAVATVAIELAQTEPVDDLGAIVAAVLYHDAVYEPQYPANERASARLAAKDLAKLSWPDERIGRVRAMIEGTDGHLTAQHTDMAVMFDADLAVLGADPDRYEKYRNDVRSEYRHLDDAEWAAGRAEVLTHFLDRPAIYATTAGNARFEAAARANLRSELDELSAEYTSAPSR